MTDCPLLGNCRGFAERSQCRAGAERVDFAGRLLAGVDNAEIARCSELRRASLHAPPSRRWVLAGAFSRGGCPELPPVRFDADDDGRPAASGGVACLQATSFAFDSAVIRPSPVVRQLPAHRLKYGDGLTPNLKVDVCGMPASPSKSMFSASALSETRSFASKPIQPHAGNNLSVEGGATGVFYRVSNRDCARSACRLSMFRVDRRNISATLAIGASADAAIAPVVP